jgi:uncharacterized delta-60 repeat protein
LQVATNEEARPWTVLSCVLSLTLVLAAGFFLPSSAGAVTTRPLRGTIDTTFGEGGRAFPDLPAALASSKFFSIEREAGGKLVLMGEIRSGQETVIERREPQGALDPGFGEGGIARIGGRSELDAGLAFGNGPAGPALQGNGGIVYAEPGPGCFAGAKIRRLEANGSADTGFAGGNGANALPFSVSKLVVDAQDRILALGTRGGFCVKSGPPLEVELARLLPDGAPDPSFGNAGVVMVEAGGKPLATAHSIAVREDGTIVLSGAVDDSHGDLVSLSPSGAPDPGFGSNGVLAVPPETGALLALPGGALLTSSSYTCCNSNAGVVVVGRYLPDGQIDASFGESGAARVAPFPGSLTEGLAAGPGGSILLTGRTEPEGKCSGPDCRWKLFAARLTSSGAPDPGFGTGGWLQLELPQSDGASQPTMPGLAVAPSGQFYLAGSPGKAGGALLLGREANGSPNPGFGTGGVVEEHGLVPSNVESLAAVVEPNGETVVYVSTDSGSLSGYHALIHFGRNGSLDGSFGSGSGLVRTESLGLLAPAGHGGVYAVRKPGMVVRIGTDGSEDPAYGGAHGAALPAAFSPRGLVVHGGELLVTGIEANRRMAAVLLDAKGKPDPGFGRNGLVVVRGSGGTVRAAAVDRRGRVLLLGAGPRGPQVVRLRPDGRPDRGFGHDGVRAGLPVRNLRVASLAALPDGGLLIAVASPSRGPIHGLKTLLMRLDRRGRLMTSFGTHGLVHAPHLGSPLGIFSSRGQLILATNAAPLGYRGLTLRAYRPNGSVDRGFGHNGAVHEASTPSLHFGPLAAGRQPDGRIVVVGKATRRYGSTEPELLRFR